MGREARGGLVVRTRGCGPAGSEARSSLAFARSLARSDVSFVLATELVRGGILAASRSVNRSVLMPSVRHDPDGYAERLVGLIAETGARVVVPVNDATLPLVTTTATR